MTDLNDTARKSGPAAVRARVDFAGRPLIIEERFRLEQFDTIHVPTAPNYLVKGIVPRDSFVVAWGPPKCGKSFWAFDLTMHIALGWPYRGHKVRQGTVVYLALEGGGGFRARVEAWRMHHSVTQSAPFFLLPFPIDLVADQMALIGTIRAQTKDAPAIVVIDTLNRSMHGDENSSEDMAKFIRATDAIRMAFKCTVLIVHHSGIAAGRPRGHTSLAGANDAQIAVERDDDGTIIAKVEHMKDAEGGIQIASRLQSVHIGQDDDGDHITSCVIVPADDAGASNAPRLKGDKRRVYDALCEAIAEVGVKSTSNRVPPGQLTCPVATWKNYFFQLKAGQPDSKRRAFVRSVDALQDAGVVGIWDDVAWLAGQVGQHRTK